MNIYIAALNSNGYKHTNRYLKLNDREKEVVNSLPHLLESYHYVNKETFVEAMRNQEDKVFIDSGAFSAYTLGVTIDLPTYVDYILRNIDIIRVDDGVVMASVLDGIGDPLETYQNQKKMEKLGFCPLPCFHAGEDTRYLEYYVKNYDYITLGGMVGSSTKQLMMWLDYVWENFLTDGSGNPRLKVHGFGITSIPLMERYPWHSCDSSSWIQSAAFGTVIMPKYGTVNVSDQSPSRHDYGQHASTLTELDKEIVFSEFERSGFNYERLSTVYESRAAYNCWAFTEINKDMNASNCETFSSPIQELF